MNIKILTNEKKNNHLKFFTKMASKSDRLIIVSPFLSDDISKLIKDMSKIKEITLYTTLQKYNDSAQKIISLCSFYECCNEKGIDLSIKIDDNLHGKVYLFYGNEKEKGFILTSGNFTENGLINNHEYGLCIEDVDKQKELKESITSINTYDLTYAQLRQMYDDAQEFIKNHQTVKQERFKVNKLINKKPSVDQKETRCYYLKPIGTAKEPFDENRPPLKEIDFFGFGKKPKTIKRDDVLLLHSVGPSSIVGYYVTTGDDFREIKYDDKDRWIYKVQAECHSSKFTANWWKYELKTQALVDEFLEMYPDKNVTVAGGKTLGALQWGRDKIQITKEFAQFIINKIPE